MIVKKLNEEGQYPINQLCEFVEIPRSTYYYHSRKTDETALVKDLKKVAGKYPTYGTRRVCGELRRPPYGYAINRKRVQRIMRHEKLLRRPKRKKRYTTDSNHPYPRYKNLVKDLEITYPDQVWVSDITYIHLRQGHVYLVIIMDVFTRAIRSWHLGRSLGQELTLLALRMALTDHVPGIHHSDQGVQYAAHNYVDLLRNYGVQISMAGTGRPHENGYAERMIRTIKEEEVDLSEYHDFTDAFNQIGHFIEDVYMTKRIHSSLGYLTPAEFESAWLSQKLLEDTP
jgi:transposase InsO family protein